MEWTDQAIVLGSRRLGEASVVVELMTEAHGRHLGVVRGGRSPRMAPLIQPGNRLRATWRARLAEHVGTYALEPLALRAAQLMERPAALFAVQVLVAHLRLLAEREGHPRLHRTVDEALGAFAAEEAVAVEAIAAFVARFELALLDELGFGLDLSRCAVTGARDGLAFVSPRSGRAVSRAGAAGYEDRLLPLARFLIGERGANDGMAAIDDAFRLTGHFLRRDVFLPRGLEEPAARRELLARLSRPEPV